MSNVLVMLHHTMHKTNYELVKETHRMVFHFQKKKRTKQQTTAK